MSTYPVDPPIETRRLDALGNAIAWGNAHYDPRLKCARAADGRVYTIPNLPYAAALLEAASEGRDVGITKREAIARGNTLLRKLLPHFTPARCPRFLAADAPALSDQHVNVQIAGILAFLQSHAKAFALQPTVDRTLSTNLAAILAPKAGTPAHPRRPGPRGGRARAADRSVITEFLATLPGGYHWALQASALDEFSIAIRGPHSCWPFPVYDCTLEMCRERCCHIARPDSPQGRSIQTYFYEGDYKPAAGPVVPVIFVGGWTPLHAAPSAGFTGQNQYSMLPPEYVPSPGDGQHMYPPNVLQLDPEVTHKKHFDGFATKLCKAGYNHVRFAQTAPADDILFAVADLYSVVDETKKLFGADNVILVGHSRGGLIARRYILDRWENEHIVDVAKLITYGTPHLGAQLAEIGSQIINGAVLPALPQFLDHELAALSQLLSIFSGIDPGQVDQIKTQEIDFISLVKPIWQDLAISLESMEQLRPNSDFMTNLNTEYSQSVLNGARNFWEAIPHVLIAGTDPSLLRLYLGCWAGELTPDGVADALEPDGSGWDFEWTWHTLLDMPTSVSSYLPALQALPAFLAGGGDFVVEKTSALADSVTGDIRRAEFAVNHFSLICEDKIVTSYGPYGPHGRHGLPLPLKLRPWQVIFWELGLPLSTVSGCDPQKNPCD